MIGLEHPRHAPGWARENELEDSLVGVCVARMIVDPLEERVAAHAITGRPGVEHTPIARGEPRLLRRQPGRGRRPRGRDDRTPGAPAASDSWVGARR